MCTKYRYDIQRESLNNEKDQIVEHNKMKIEEMHLGNFSGR